MKRNDSVTNTCLDFIWQRTCILHLCLVNSVMVPHHHYSKLSLASCLMDTFLKQLVVFAFKYQIETCDLFEFLIVLPTDGKEFLIWKVFQNFTSSHLRLFVVLKGPFGSGITFLANKVTKVFNYLVRIFVIKERIKQLKSEELFSTWPQLGSIYCKSLELETIILLVWQALGANKSFCEKWRFGISVLDHCLLFYDKWVNLLNIWIEFSISDNSFWKFGCHLIWMLIQITRLLLLLVIILQLNGRAIITRSLAYSLKESSTLLIIFSWNGLLQIRWLLIRNLNTLLLIGSGIVASIIFGHTFLLFL